MPTTAPECTGQKPIILVAAIALVDADGRVLCEDSYSGGEFAGFEGIAERPVRPDEIFRWADDPTS